MFRFQKEQKVFSFGGIKVGGQPGDRPPLLIASMFHNKDKIMEDRKGEKWEYLPQPKFDHGVF